MIDNYTVYTARELREALGEIRTFVPKDREDLRDVIYYVFQFLTRLAWLGRAVDRFDPARKFERDSSQDG